jgi:hypothetical protein
LEPPHSLSSFGAGLGWIEAGYLQDMEIGYLLSFHDMKEDGKDHRILFEEVWRIRKSYSTHTQLNILIEYSRM